MDRALQIVAGLRKIWLQSVIACLGGAGTGLLNGMGIIMKKLVLAAAVLAITAGSAFAADMPAKAFKAPPPAPFAPWDLTLCESTSKKNVFRGLTQSNHETS